MYNYKRLNLKLNAENYINLGGSTQVDKPWNIIKLDIKSTPIFCK